MISDSGFMKCDICGKREAMVFIQQIMGGDKVEVHLCEVCAGERGISSEGEKFELSLSDLLSDLVNVKDAKGRPEPQVCSNCGRSAEEITKTGVIGCAECYAVFAEQIRGVLDESGVPTRHLGKFPRRLRAFKTYLVDVARLKKGLREAVHREDYEKAAAIRDRIRELESLAGD